MGHNVPVLVNHDVNVWGVTGVVTTVDGGRLPNLIRIGVPTTAAKPGLQAIESRGGVRAVRAECVG